MPTAETEIPRRSSGQPDERNDMSKHMSKLIFLPLRLGAGISAGIVGRKIFDRLWALIDSEQPPKAEYRRVALSKLALALAVEGAIFRVLKGLADHGSRSAFAHLTGSWPGDEAPQPE
jgi:hypothetical protein